ncbi:MAG TPA: complex I subunit 1 family protein [Microthrixaceae bacterium]|nr:complex I subunit 1 family protein [Microthrixaceae bacterium]
MTQALLSQHAVLGLELAYWQQTILRVLLGLVALLGLTGGVVYLYLFKFVSFMQSRLGPMEAGPHGSLQLLAEVGKWLQKEDVFTENSDRVVFGLAPVIVLASTFLMFIVIPAGPNAVIADLGTGIYFVLAMSGLSVIGILMAGWASANKYALMGALRAGGQLIAYELPLVLATVGVVISAGSLNLQDIVNAQAGPEAAIFGWTGIGNPYILTQGVAFLIFMISVQAELTQSPFDMPIAESELVAGYQVEYTGIRFLIYFIAEFATAVAFAAVASTLFLGGWALPSSWGLGTGVMHVVGPMVISVKAVILVGVVFWVRFTLPRYREDQLQRIAWKGLIPLALANIVITALAKVVF